MGVTPILPSVILHIRLADSRQLPNTASEELHLALKQIFHETILPLYTHFVNCKKSQEIMVVKR